MKPIRDIPKTPAETIANTSATPDGKSKDIQSHKEKQIDAASTTVKHRIPTNATKDIKTPVNVNNLFDSAFMTTVVLKNPKSSAASAGSTKQVSQAQSHFPAHSVATANAAMTPSNTVNASVFSAVSARAIPVNSQQKPINNYSAPVTTFDIKNFQFDYDKHAKTVTPQGRLLGSEFNLNEDEMVAISAYTQDCYKAINYQLRNLPDPTVNIYDAKALKDSGVSEDLAFLIANLVNGLKKLPPAYRDTGSGAPINRGIGRDVNLPAEELAKFQEGKIVSSSMLTSTTSALEQMVEGQWWSNNPHSLIIHQQLNGNGRDIAAFSMYPHESEIIFLPDTKFKVTYRKDDTVMGGPVNRDSLRGKTEEEIRQAYNDPTGPTYQKTVITLTEMPSA
ncbi:MAG: hypothetical protein RI928_1400 [Pseudomonadota bacterium]|jgi:hypothetical protein